MWLFGPSSPVGPAPQPLFDPFSAPDAGAGCRFAANTVEYRTAHPHAKSAAGASTDHIKPLVDVQLRATAGILRHQLKQSGTGLAELALGALRAEHQQVVVDVATLRSCLRPGATLWSCAGEVAQQAHSVAP